MMRHGLTPLRRRALELIQGAGMNGISLEALAVAGFKRSTLAWLEDGLLICGHNVHFSGGIGDVLRLRITPNGEAALRRFPRRTP